MSLPKPKPNDFSLMNLSPSLLNNPFINNVIFKINSGAGGSHKIDTTTHNQIMDGESKHDKRDMKTQKRMIYKEHKDSKSKQFRNEIKQLSDDIRDGRQKGSNTQNRSKQINTSTGGAGDQQTAGEKDFLCSQQDLNEEYLRNNHRKQTKNEFSASELSPVSLEMLIEFLTMRKNACKQFRQSENIRNLVLSLHDHTIDKLREQFSKHGNTVDLTKFFQLMKKSVDFGDGERYSVFYDLIRLFDEIDADQSHSIDWDELFEFLSCANWAAGPSGAYTKTCLLGAEEEIDPVVKFAFKDQTGKIRKFPVKKIIEVPRLRYLCILEKKDSISYTSVEESSEQETESSQDMSDSSEDSQKQLKLNCSESVLSFDYSQAERLFGILYSNRTISFIEDREMQKRLALIKGVGNQMDIIYLRLHRKWALITLENSISVFSSPKSGEIASRVSFHCHTEPITAVKQIANPLAVCTSSLDKTIKLWSFTYNQLLIVINPSKEQIKAVSASIRGIDTANIQKVSYIASWMFSSEIHLWNPSASLSKPYAGSLSGHMGIVQDCRFFGMQQLLLSIDEKCTLKVWSLESMSCLQNLTLASLTARIMNLRCRPSLVLIYDRTLQFYRIRNPKVPSAVQTQGQSTANKRNLISMPSIQLIDILYSEFYQVFVILTNQELRIVTASSAAPLASVRLKPDQLEQFTCMCIKLDRRIFVAKSGCQILYQKIEDATLLAKIDLKAIQDTHFQRKVSQQKGSIDQETKFMYYHDQLRTLLVICEQEEQSLAIIIVEQSQTDFKVIKRLFFTQTRLICFKFIAHAQAFVIGSTDGTVSLWDFQKFHLVSMFTLGKDMGPLKQISVIPDAYCLVILQSCGFLLLQIDKMIMPGILKLIKRSNVVDDYQASEVCTELNEDGSKKILLHVASKTQFISFNITQAIPESSAQPARLINKKGHFFKETRKANCTLVLVKREQGSDAMNEVESAGYSAKSNVTKMGSVGALLYVFCQREMLALLTKSGQCLAEWHYVAELPSRWALPSYHIEEISRTLERMEKALVRINEQIVTNDTRKFFVASTCLKREYLPQLLEYCQNNHAKVMLNLRKAMQQGSQPKGPQKEHQEDPDKKFSTFSSLSKKITDKVNVFERKYNNQQKNEEQKRAEKLKNKAIAKAEEMVWFTDKISDTLQRRSFSGIRSRNSQASRSRIYDLNGRPVSQYSKSSFAFKSPSTIEVGSSLVIGVSQIKTGMKTPEGSTLSRLRRSSAASLGVSRFAHPSSSPSPAPSSQQTKLLKAAIILKESKKQLKLKL